MGCLASSNLPPREHDRKSAPAWASSVTVNVTAKKARLKKSAGLVYLCSLPWIMWYGIKRRRFGYVAAAMLSHQRCPHCGYDLRMLPADSDDGATICPECGCAWQLGEERG